MNAASATDCSNPSIAETARRTVHAEILNQCAYRSATSHTTRDFTPALDVYYSFSPSLIATVPASPSASFPVSTVDRSLLFPFSEFYFAPEHVHGQQHCFEFGLPPSTSPPALVVNLASHFLPVTQLLLVGFYVDGVGLSQTPPVALQHSTFSTARFGAAIGLGGQCSVLPASSSCSSPGRAGQARPHPS